VSPAAGDHRAEMPIEHPAHLVEVTQEIGRIPVAEIL
jgi:hypothetical protein